ncbi:unnamed protein product [Durusdinium trenchii]|uniref:Uncharacterized protein n=1 Tax=Durusdinium trenchii TaxID=1381693 RepID=A0ABP0KYZ6_9DINO
MKRAPFCSHLPVGSAHHCSSEVATGSGIFHAFVADEVSGGRCEECSARNGALALANSARRMRCSQVQLRPRCLAGPLLTMFHRGAGCSGSTQESTSCCGRRSPG